MRVNTLYGTKEVVTDQGRQMELQYYLVQDIKSEIVHETKGADGVTYGVGIVKRECTKEEREWLPGLTASMEQAEQLLRRMMYGLVTPVTAAAVTEDWISECAG
jgi:hypothetical protein